MPKFTKKPVTIEAFQITEETSKDNKDWPNWLNEAWQKPKIEPGAVYPGGEMLAITTLEGIMSVSPGDWIIQGVKGELYPCKPDIFEQTYNPVTDELVCVIFHEEIVTIATMSGIGYEEFNHDYITRVILDKLKRYGFTVIEPDGVVNNPEELIRFIPNSTLYRNSVSSFIIRQKCD